MKELTIRNKVKVARIEHGLYNQGDFAKLIGVTRQTINLIETQKYNPTIRVCLLISKALDTPLDELFWIEE